MEMRTANKDSRYEFTLFLATSVVWAPSFPQQLAVAAEILDTSPVCRPAPLAQLVEQLTLLSL